MITKIFKNLLQEVDDGKIFRSGWKKAIVSLAKFGKWAAPKGKFGRIKSFVLPVFIFYVNSSLKQTIASYSLVYWIVGLSA